MGTICQKEPKCWNWNQPSNANTIWKNKIIELVLHNFASKISKESGIFLKHHPTWYLWLVRPPNNIFKKSTTKEMEENSKLDGKEDEPRSWCIIRLCRKSMPQHLHSDTEVSFMSNIYILPLYKTASRENIESRSPTKSIHLKHLKMAMKAKSIFSIFKLRIWMQQDAHVRVVIALSPQNIIQNKTVLLCFQKERGIPKPLCGGNSTVWELLAQSLETIHVLSDEDGMMNRVSDDRQIHTGLAAAFRERSWLHCASRRSKVQFQMSPCLSETLAFWDIFTTNFQMQPLKVPLIKYVANARPLKASAFKQQTTNPPNPSSVDHWHN